MTDLKANPPFSKGEEKDKRLGFPIKAFWNDEYRERVNYSNRAD